jgi:hypothetical protein
MAFPCKPVSCKYFYGIPSISHEFIAQLNPKNNGLNAPGNSVLNSEVVVGQTFKYNPY